MFALFFCFTDINYFGSGTWKTSPTIQTTTNFAYFNYINHVISWEIRALKQYKSVWTILEAISKPWFLQRTFSMAISWNNNNNLFFGFFFFHIHLVQCGGDIHVNGTGEIKSPRYPLHYPIDIVCEWKMCVKEGSRITLTFTDFEVHMTF